MHLKHNKLNFLDQITKNLLELHKEHHSLGDEKSAIYDIIMKQKLRVSQQEIIVSKLKW